MPEANNNPPEDDPPGETISDLRSWLLDRVGDDNDIVVDELQEDFAAGWHEKEEAGLGKAEPVEGSKEYVRNVTVVAKQVEEMKQQRVGIVSTADAAGGGGGKRKMVSDGDRKCYFVGQTDERGRPHGQGGLQYENMDVFRGMVWKKIDAMKETKPNCRHVRPWYLQSHWQADCVWQLWFCHWHLEGWSHGGRNEGGRRIHW